MFFGDLHVAHLSSINTRRLVLKCTHNCHSQYGESVLCIIKLRTSFSNQEVKTYHLGLKLPYTYMQAKSDLYV